ncbi:uncharacterized protein LOC123539802 [Mercenaria mercenaria]|uniref:uncharacterized protein LOC123539802 n=1 Tax=Mercenaria mercenaria TaxID=6596 RepID=UPI00234F7EFD|nr:uncharacterized protein LOC123539802 [Mercenaria mercenaria]
MDSPINGIILCNGWRKEYSHICIFACKQNHTLPPGYKADDVYVCGATGHWLPANPVPQCVSEKLFPGTQVQRFPSCTKPTDKADLAEFYIDFLKKSAVNALCEQHSDDCKPQNVDIEC